VVWVPAPALGRIGGAVSLYEGIRRRAPGFLTQRVEVPFDP